MRTHCKSFCGFLKELSNIAHSSLEFETNRAAAPSSATKAILFKIQWSKMSTLNRVKLTYKKFSSFGSQIKNQKLSFR